MFKVPEEYRVTVGKFSTAKENGNNGVFYVPIPRKLSIRLKEWLQVIASDGLGWEHVSVCVVNFNKSKVIERTATWDEMCMVKDMFWDKGDVCVQFHPDEKNYVNRHKFVLHIWRKIGSMYELPSRIMV